MGYLKKMGESLRTEAEAWLGHLDFADPKKIEHFCNGWAMWPEYWPTSTADWKAGFLARQRTEKEK